MAPPFFDSSIAKKRDQVMAVDLGSRTTKAVWIQRHGQGLALCGFTLLDAPIYEKTMSRDLLSEHLRAVNRALQPKTKYVSLTVGLNDAQVRHADIPRMPIPDMRLLLKFNSKTYLQQDLAGYVFDCHVGAQQSPNSKSADKLKDPAGAQKQKVLVAGARAQLIDDFVEGAKGAGLVADCIVPTLIGPVNSFERAMPELFAKEAIALLDVGFRNSSICILMDGELALSRVVGIGSDKLTSGLAESLNISYAEAESIKIGMPAEVQSQLESLVLPLGREFRASIDFFEHQQDRAVSQAFITGGSARSEMIVRILQQELMIDCKVLDPTANLEKQLSAEQLSEIDPLAPQLAVALGTAMAAL
jgi:type IV pilus assembly protein PilM